MAEKGHDFKLRRTGIGESGRPRFPKPVRRAVTDTRFDSSVMKPVAERLGLVGKVARVGYEEQARARDEIDNLREFL